MVLPCETEEGTQFIGSMHKSIPHPTTKNWSREVDYKSPWFCNPSKPMPVAFKKTMGSMVGHIGTHVCIALVQEEWWAILKKIML